MLHCVPYQSAPLWFANALQSGALCMACKHLTKLIWLANQSGCFGTLRFVKLVQSFVPALETQRGFWGTKAYKALDRKTKLSKRHTKLVQSFVRLAKWCTLHVVFGNTATHSKGLLLDFGSHIKCLCWLFCSSNQIKLEYLLQDKVVNYY